MHFGGPQQVNEAAPWVNLGEGKREMERCNSIGSSPAIGVVVG